MTTSKHFWLIIVLIIAIPIYLTYSYAAWLAIAASIFLMIYLIMPAAKIKALFISVFLISAVLFFSQAGSGKFENLKNLSYRSSYNSRLMIWRSALAIGWDHPVFGIGPGRFQEYYLDYQRKFNEPYLEWAVPQPHNIFLAFWLEIGILGLAGFFLILYWFFKAGILILRELNTLCHPERSPAGRSRRIPPYNSKNTAIPRDSSLRFASFRMTENNKRVSFILKEPRLSGVRNAAVVLISIMVYILLHGLFDTTYWKNDLAVVFWLILGLMAVIKKSAN